MYGIINAKIYTVDGPDWDVNPKQAMAVDDDGTIICVGTNEEIKAIAGDNIRDMDGKTILPGFIDSHVHVPGISFAELFQIFLFGVFDVEGSVEVIRDYVQAHPEKEEYFGQGFNMGMFTDGSDVVPANLIDEVTDKPVTIQSYDCHSFWLNTAAMERYGIDHMTETKGSGLIHRTADGKPNGIFTDVNDIGIGAQEFTKEEQIEALKHFIQKMNAWGYTSAMNVSPTFGISFKRYLDLEDDELSLRVSMSHFIDPKNPDWDHEDMIRMREEIKSDKLKVTTAKYMIDGVLEGNTAFLKEPYHPNAGLGDDYNSPPEWEMESMKKSWKRAIEDGFQIHAHVIGDGALEMALDALEYAGEGHDPDEMRNTLTHLHVVPPHEIERMAKLGVIAAIQPFWHLKEPDFHETIEIPALGEERIHMMYPAKSLVNAGVRITSSGDFPVSFLNNPFIGIRAGVTRNLCSEEYYGFDIDDTEDPRFLLLPEERLSVKDMVEAYTINGAYEMFRDDETGSLVQGKFADYIVLDQDIMHTDHLKLDKIKVLETVFGGRTVMVSAE